MGSIDIVKCSLFPFLAVTAGQLWKVPSFPVVAACSVFKGLSDPICLRFSVGHDRLMEL